MDEYPQVLPRHIAPAIRESLRDTPVVFLQGARQVGKSTLARQLIGDDFPARYITLDDATALSAARGNPQDFLSGFPGTSLVIDEVQRAPELALAIKRSVDADRKPGRFLLTGSANVLLLPGLSESLAGRIDLHTLWPLSQGEIEGRTEVFLDAIFSSELSSHEIPGEDWPSLASRIARGGYPEMLARVDPKRRSAWFGSYITTILQRDVRDISNVRDLSDLPRMLVLAGSRAAKLLEYADLARSLSIPQTTLKRHAALLEATFMIRSIPAWFTNIGKRLVKAPKLLVGDSGLLTHLLGFDEDRLRTDKASAGGILENFVALELLKQRGWSRVAPTLHHFRTHAGEEVDFVLEDSAGRIVGIEVKAATTVGTNDVKGLKALQAAAGNRFVRGIVLHTGEEVLPLSAKVLAMPIAALWTTP